MERLTVKLASAAPSQRPGQQPRPHSTTAATATPEGSQTAVAYPGGMANTSDAFAAAKYASARIASLAACGNAANLRATAVMRRQASCLQTTALPLSDIVRHRARKVAKT
jgi:hypothetical protein